MRIGLLTPQSLPVLGGLQMVVDALARQLVHSGHEVRLFTPTPHAKFPYPVSPINALPPFYPVSPQTMPILEKGLEEFLEREYRKNPFDLLHAHLVYPTGFCALGWGKPKGIPVVITCHGIDVIGRPEDDYGFLLDKLLAEKVRQCLSQSPTLTIVGSHLKEHLLKLGASKEAISTIPNGVFPDDFHNNDEEGMTPYILAMGCLHRIKGFDSLLEAFAMAGEKVPEMTLTIAGEGPDRAMLIEKSLSMNLTGRVRFLPFLRGKEKIRCFAGCRFVVCPSRYESFGMVILEANASGKPVLGFSVGGIRELIDHEKNGLLVPPGDIEGLACNMIKLWNREIRFPVTPLIEAARKYEWKTVIRKYLCLYQSLIR